WFKKRFAFLIAAGSALISCNKSNSPSESVLFESQPSSITNIGFANNLDMSKSFRVLYFFYYYNGAGVATGDINNDGLPDLYFTANNHGSNKLYLNKGNFKFEDITVQAGVAGNSDWCTGVTMVDVNGDGLLDIYVSSVNNIYNFKGRNELYINNGNSSFTEKAEQYGLAISSYANQASFFDYDHDGDLDCYVLNESFKPSENLVDTSYRKKFDPNSGDRLYRNDISTNGHFTDVSTSAGIYQSSLGYGLGISVADLNNDGWEDIYIGNDFQENDYYYINNGNGTFTESSSSHFNHYSRFSMGNDIGDYDNDGQLDIITTDMLPKEEKIIKTYGSGEGAETYKFTITQHGYQPQYSKNCLHRNNGDGKSFSDIGFKAGVSATDWSWAPLFADFDNDGNKDLFITSGIPKRTVDLDYIKFVSSIVVPPGADPKEEYNKALDRMPDGAYHNFIFQGNGKGDFTDKSAEWGTEKDKGYHNGAAYADLDNDGDLDVVINTINSPALVYKNNSPKKNYLSLLLNGNTSNKLGIGTKVYVYTKENRQYQQLMLTRGFQSSVEARLHFGLGSSDQVDSLLIIWPDQQYQVIRNITGNKQLTINQKEAGSLFVYTQFFPSTKPVLEEIAGMNDTWSHHENDYNDFQRQYLLPHEQSIKGPRLAIADVNKDGLDDFFVCGAKEQPGCLMLQTDAGKFVPANTALFSKDAMAEDVDAVFFDMDKDGDSDLYVVSGGNEYDDGNRLLGDRMYTNDGKGNFSKKENNLPALYINKSCVSAGDMDADGDIDVFVGGSSQSGHYGGPSTSFLLLNDGKGNFTEAPGDMIGLKNIGLVTSSVITDINKDGKNDLIIAGEWMPVIAFINENNKYTSHALSKTGLWQSLSVKDINGDGSPDIFAGNWGLNSKLSAGKQSPLRLYVKDFDNNGMKDVILSYAIADKQYPFLNKDELEQAVPLVKKKFLYYTDFAGRSIQEIFDLTGDIQTQEAAELSSAVFYNDGKGNFTKEELPAELQLSPLFAFEQLKNSGSWIAGGNFFGVLPYEGQYDATSLVWFELNNKDKGASKSQSQVLDIKGQVRDMKWLHTKNGEILIVAKNNDRLRFYKARG
ncbi:MAG: VCBS repeat-containing protein, partial [Chitinophagaceae bacterium]